MRNSYHAGFALLLSSFLCFSILSGATCNSARAQQLEPKASTARGIQLYKQGDLSGAGKVLQEVVEKHPEDAGAWYYLGLAFYNDGWIGAAREPFEHVIALRPNSADAHAKLSYSLILANEPDKAGTIANRAIDLGDKSAAPHYALAEASLRLAAILRPTEEVLRNQTLEVAIDYAETALKIDPSFSLALITKSFALNKLKKYSEAAASLDQFLALNPADVDATIWREEVAALRASDAQSTMTAGTVPLALSSREVTTKTRVLSKPEPSYTEAARRAGVQGTVVLRAVFSADGEVKSVRVGQALPFGLTTAAIEAAHRIKFTPATKDGQPVSMFIQLEYNFNLY